VFSGRLGISESLRKSRRGGDCRYGITRVAAVGFRGGTLVARAFAIYFAID
jgi:hypothetical protein